MELTFSIAFIAGLLSFISPCVLPLAPAYVGYLSGGVTHALATNSVRPTPNRFKTVSHALCFVGGFTLVFVGIGLLSTTFVQQIGGENITRVTAIIGRFGGVLIIFFGLHFAGIIPAVLAWFKPRLRLLDHLWVTALLAVIAGVFILWGFTGSLRIDDPAQPSWAFLLGVIAIGTLWVGLIVSTAFSKPREFWERVISLLETALYSDTRSEFRQRGRWGYGSSLLMGVIFSAGWTPCIGPVYGAVLTMAAHGGSVGQAGFLLTAYSLGLGIPFLLLSLLLERAQTALKHLQRHLRTVQLISGVLLILIGILVAGGQLQQLSQQFAGDYAEFAVQLENAVLHITMGNADVEPPFNMSAPQANTAAQIGLNVGDLAPDFSTTALDGTPSALSDYRGQVVILNFWATWCGPCRIEMPGFERQYRDHSDDGLVILAVNNRETVEPIARFGAQFGLTFPLLLDLDGAIQAQYGIVSYPASFVIGRDGVIAAKHLGIFTPAQVAQTVAQMIGTS